MLWGGRLSGVPLACISANKKKGRRSGAREVIAVFWISGFRLCGRFLLEIEVVLADIEHDKEFHSRDDHIEESYREQNS